MAVVDVRLGDSYGVELVKSLREINPEVQAILLTAYASIDTVLDAMRVDVFDFLRKPVDPTELFRSLDNCFRTIALRREKQWAEATFAERNAELEQINRRLRRVVETAAELTTAVRSDQLDSKLLQAITGNMAARGGSLFYTP